jgi:light-regulated signal transduction histidine kinase (bacteriophytochrome)
MFGIFRDITKQRITDEYLTHFTAKLNRINRELQDFVFIASHDLQEPLRKIQAFGDLIKNKSYHLLDDQNKNYFDRIMNASKRMQILLGDLLKYSRLVTKAQAIVKLNLKEVIQKVISDISFTIQNANATIHIGELPIIEADQNQMYELFRTLIQNAIKFRREGQPPVIKIYNELAKKNDIGKVIVNHCRIVISDNGIGFDEKYANRIFGVFQRLHSRNKYQGTGMGLAIARRIAERHMGNITVKSQEGEGSTFTVTLPIMQTEEEIIHDDEGKTD